jgi:hyperosmotically inducible protein
MLNKILSVALVALIAGFSINAVADTTQPTGKSETAKQYVSGSTITADVKEKLLADSDIKSLHISVKTVKGVVTLTGKVETKAQKEKAAEIAKNVEGVKSVVNKLKLDVKVKNS